MSQRPKASASTNGRVTPKTWAEYFRSPGHPVTRNEMEQFMAVHVKHFHAKPWYRRLWDRVRGSR